MSKTLSKIIHLHTIKHRKNLLNLLEERAQQLDEIKPTKPYKAIAIGCFSHYLPDWLVYR